MIEKENGSKTDREKGTNGQKYHGDHLNGWMRGRHNIAKRERQTEWMRQNERERHRESDREKETDRQRYSQIER